MNWYKKSQLNIQPPPLLYHGTFASNLESIKQRGLDPNYEGIVKCWPDCEKGIYLTVDADMAGEWPEQADNPDMTDEMYDSGTILLEIDTNFLDKVLLDQDPEISPPDNTGSYIYRGVIPFSAVKNIL
jgi:hypothetical protein